jgi:hypothetical protein
VIAIVTAVVTAGAMGPAAPTRDPSAAAGACAATTLPGADTVASPAASAQGVDAHSAAAWWLLPAPMWAVDPRTGRIVEIGRAAAPRFMDHRAQDQ